MSYIDKLEALTLPKLYELSKTIFESSDESEIVDACDTLIKLTPIPCLEVSGLSELYRARVDIPQAIGKLDEILWKPNHLHVDNRANTGAEQLLYFANHIHTCIEEVRVPPSINLPVNVIAMGPSKECSIFIFPVGELYHVLRTNSSRFILPEIAKEILGILKDLGEEKSMTYCLADAMVLDAFSGDNRIISNAISRAIFSNMKEEGLLAFTSAKHYGALNYACRPSFLLSSLKLKGGLFCPKAKFFGYGMWDVNCTKYISSVSAKGRVNWKNMQGILGSEKVKPIASECFRLNMDIKANMGHPISTSEN